MIRLDGLLESSVKYGEGLAIGEVRRGLLLTSTAVRVDTAAELLAIVPGGSVRIRQAGRRRPWSHYLSTRSTRNPRKGVRGKPSDRFSSRSVNREAS